MVGQTNSHAWGLTDRQTDTQGYNYDIDDVRINIGLHIFGKSRPREVLHFTDR